MAEEGTPFAPQHIPARPVDFIMCIEMLLIRVYGGADF